MSIGNAIAFIKDFRRDQQLRHESYGCENGEQFTLWLKKKRYDFTAAEFEDAIRTLLLKVANQDGADEIRQIEQWYRLMNGEG